MAITREQLEDWNSGETLDVRTPYAEGEQAYARGVPRAACKYTEPCLKRWQDGWDDAAAEASFILSTNRFVH